MMKFLKSITEMFADQDSGHAPEDSVKRKFIATIKQADGTEVEKNVKAFSIDDIKYHFGKSFVSAELHPDEQGEEDDDRTADEVEADEADLEESLFKSVVHEATLGSRIEFPNYKAWKAALPPKSTMHKDGKLERAQALSKDFEGVAGTWDEDKGEGWIYAHYLKKENLVEAKSTQLPTFYSFCLQNGVDEDELDDVIDNAYDQDTDEFALAKDVKQAIGKADIKSSKEKALKVIKSLAKFTITGTGPGAKKAQALIDKFAEAAYKNLATHWADLNEELIEGLTQLAEMAKRTKPDDFYAMAKKKYGVDKVKSLKWPEIVAVAKENDVLIPPYLRTQKVGRGSFNLVPPEHADTKPAPKEEPKAAAPKAEPKKEEPSEEKKYTYPQLQSVSYNDWSEFYRALKKVYGDFELQRIPYGAQSRGRFGGQLGQRLLVDKKTDKVIGVWEVTGEDKVPGRGMVAYGRGQIAKEKQEAPKAAPKPAERRAGGNASDDELKTALLDVASEMKHHKDNRGAGWRTTPEKEGKRYSVDVRHWGHWEGDDGSGDYDYQELSRASSKEIANILRGAEARHKNVKLSYESGEKNWLYIYAE